MALLAATLAGCGAAPMEPRPAGPAAGRVVSAPTRTVGDTTRTVTDTTGRSGGPGWIDPHI